MTGLGQLFGWARPRASSSAPQPPPGPSPDPFELAYYGTRILVERHAALFPGAGEALRRGSQVAPRCAELPPAFRDASRIVLGDVLWTVDGWYAAAGFYRQLLAECGEPAGGRGQACGAAFWVWLRCRYSPVDALAHGIRFFEMKHFLVEYREALAADGLVPADASWETAPGELLAILASAPFTAVQPPARRGLALAGVPFRFEYADIAAALRERLTPPAFPAPQAPLAASRPITAGVRSSPLTVPRAG
jgi:hypothetical protein